MREKAGDEVSENVVTLRLDENNDKETSNQGSSLRRHDDDDGHFVRKR